MKKLVLLAPTGSAQVKGSVSLAMPTSVYRLVGALPPDVEVHVVDMKMRYGIPLDEASEAQTTHALLNDLDPLVDKDTVIGFSCTSTADIVFSLPLARDLKARYGCYILMGGYAPSTYCEFLLKQYGQWLDGIIVGAGEIPLRRFFEQWQDGRVRAEHVPNLAWLKDGAVTLNPRVCPLPADELAVMDIAGLQHASLYPYIAYNSSVGCPYHCQFCVEKQVHPRYDARSAGLVIADLVKLRERSRLSYVGFHDPIFGLRRDLQALLEQISELGIEYIFQTRVDALDRKWYPLLSHGCRFIFFGLEEVSVPALMRMGKTDRAERYLQEVDGQIKACLDAGIMPVIALLPNYPLNTLEDAEACLRFAERLRRMYEESGAQSGLAFTPFQFRIEYGSTHQRDLPSLTTQGVHVRPYFPAEYQGISLPAELMYQVEDASPSLPLASYRRIAGQIMAQSVLPPQRYAPFSRYYVIDLDPFVERQLNEAEFYTDAAQRVVSVQGLTRYFSRYAELSLGLLAKRLGR